MGISIEFYRRIIQGKKQGLFASLARAGLQLASWPYGFASRIRNLAYQRTWLRIHMAEVPVVSVGNLSLGGTGKTPCVEYVARFYRDLEIPVVILSRGYGSTRGANDEALVLEENLPDVPHLQGGNRVELAAAAVDELEAELLLLDDGFQHRRLHRELDIVLIDSTSPPSNDYLFPRGTLREAASGLKRASAIVLTRVDQITREKLSELQKWLLERHPKIPVALAEHRPLELIGLHETSDLSVLRGLRVAGFCGIGNPESFRQSLIDIGATVVGFREYPDHHAYTRKDVDDLNLWAQTFSEDCWVITTQKDWVKLLLPDLGGHPIRALRIGMYFREGQDHLDALLRNVLPSSRISFS